MNQEILIAGVGLIVTSLTGATAFGVKRLLNHTDVLRQDSKQHGEAIVALQVMMPNGEWKELKNSVASVHGTVREIQSELSEMKGDVSDLKIEFRENGANEKSRMVEAIKETYPKLRPIPRKTSHAKRKVKRRSRGFEESWPAFVLL